MRDVAAHALPGVGSVASLWRYPVKSMLGEALSAASIEATGVAGDREFALVDLSDGKIASAKNPRKWPRLFECGAALDAKSVSGAAASAIRITLPDGTVLRGDAPEASATLSHILGRDVEIRARRPSSEKSLAEGYWPDIEGFPLRDGVREYRMPEGMFFDAAVLHIVTTASLERFGESYAQGRFDERRFRPNIVVDTRSARGFVENDWIGRTLRIGDEVRLQITMPCSRCVMTTLAQDDLPNDLGILRTVAQQNDAVVGVYAAVAQAGTIRLGDPLVLE